MAMDAGDDRLLGTRAQAISTIVTFNVVLFVSKEILDEPGGDVTWQGWAWSFVIAAVAAALVMLLVRYVERGD